MKGPEYYDKQYSEGYDWKSYRSNYERIIKNLPKDKNIRILDLGCGMGGFLKTCWDAGYKNLCGVDFSEIAIKKARKLLSKKFLPGRLIISDLNDAANFFIKEHYRFNVIVMIEVLEHIDKDIELIKKFRETLATEGLDFIIGTVPNRQMPPEVTESHVRMYDERSFMERFNLPGRLLARSKIGESVMNFILFKFWKTVPEPKISFVVPAYMGDHYLSETIESIANQTIEEIEIIVVNDGSPDYTHDLMQWWLKNDARIRYFRFKKNKGVVHARNFGNKQAKAPIICVSDQDDISMPERAERTLYYFNREPKIDVLYSAFHETDVDGEPLSRIDAHPMDRDIFVRQTTLKNLKWFHSSSAYRKKDILDMPYRKGRYGETDDWIFLDRWTKAGKYFRPVQEVLANCRRLPTGVMAERKRKLGLPPNYTL